MSNRPPKITCGGILKRLVHLACFTNVPVVSYTLRKEEDDGGEILGGTGYGRWGRVFLFSKSTPSYDTDAQGRSIEKQTGPATVKIQKKPRGGCGRGAPSRPAGGYGGALEAPPSGSGAPPQEPTLFDTKNYACVTCKHYCR